MHIMYTSLAASMNIMAAWWSFYIRLSARISAPVHLTFAKCMHKLLVHSVHPNACGNPPLMEIFSGWLVEGKSSQQNIWYDPTVMWAKMTVSKAFCRRTGWYKLGARERGGLGRIQKASMRRSFQIGTVISEVWPRSPGVGISAQGESLTESFSACPLLPFPFSRSDSDRWGCYCPWPWLAKRPLVRGCMPYHMILHASDRLRRCT